VGPRDGRQRQGRVPHLQGGGTALRPPEHPARPGADAGRHRPGRRLPRQGRQRHRHRPHRRRRRGGERVSPARGCPA
jgi:hypothetical protein